MKIWNKIQNLISPQVAAFSHKGRKNVQEDSYYISPKIKGNTLIFVSDGVGGHRHGEFASNLCVNIFKNDFENTKKISDAKQFLNQTTLKIAAKLLNKANEDSDYKNTGATLSGFFLKPNKFYIINVGDSRVYYLKNSRLIRATKDHSVVQELIDKKMITPHEATSHPKRHIMTSALGQNLSQLKIDIKGPFKLAKGERLLACTDGVHDALSDTEIKLLLSQDIKSQKIAEELVLNAFEKGINDNITACVYIH